ncbi:MAG: FMN-binding protein [Eubacteriaceae bacterium]|nr:FMN-binding protein [Eubacteriaceae bacterium]
MNPYKKRLAAYAVLIALLFGLCACTKKSLGLKAGKYTGIGTGYGGQVEISLTVSGHGDIFGFEAISHNETAEYAAEVIQPMFEAIVQMQALGIDAISGATITSQAILEAAADAVEQAGGDLQKLGYTPKEASSNDAVIVFSGLGQGGIELTGHQLRTEFPMHEVTATSVSSSGETNEVNAKAALLEEVLNSFGVSQKDFISLYAEATDGYSVSIPDSMMQDRDIYIAYEVNGSPEWPRTIIPDERAAYWCKFLSKIELLGASETERAQALSCYFLEAVALEPGIAKEPYDHGGQANEAFKISSLISKYAADEEYSFIYIDAFDGWKRSEKKETFEQQYIVISGEEEMLPMYVGPNLPEGMMVKRIESFQIGRASFASLENIIEKNGGNITINDLAGKLGMQQADMYALSLTGGSRANASSDAVLSITEAGVHASGISGAVESFSAIKQQL